MGFYDDIVTGQKKQKDPNENTETGSGFVDLNKYLNVNQPEQLGQKVGQKVQSSFDAAGNALTQGADQQKAQIAEKNQTPNELDVNTALLKPEEADAKQFQSWMNQDYKGPNDASTAANAWGDYWNKANAANAQAKSLRTEGGRMALLDSYFGRPEYSTGEKGLDSFFLQNSGLQSGNYRKAGADLNSLQSKTLGGVNQAIGQAASDVDASRKNVRAKIGVDDKGNVIQGENAGSLGMYYDDVNRDLKTANDSRTKEWDTLQKDIASNSLTANERSKLGLSEGQNLLGLDLSKYLTKGQDVTKDQIMTPEQRSKIQALSKLAGVTDTFAANPSQTMGMGYSMDQNRFKTDLSSNQSALNQQLDSAANKYGLDPSLARQSPEQLMSNLKDALNKARQGDEYSGMEYVGYANQIKSFLNEVAPIYSKYGMSFSMPEFPT